MLTRSTFLVKEHVGMFKTHDFYDILDIETQEKIGEAQEITPGWVIALRFVVNKQFLPKHIIIRDIKHENHLLMLDKGFTFLQSKVYISNEEGTRTGYLKSKLFSLKGGFDIYDMQDKKVAHITGNWKGWTFTMQDANGNELGTVAKKWAGLAKELFTSADTYVISINDENAHSEGVKLLLLAAGIAIDTVYAEGGG